MEFNVSEKIDPFLPAVLRQLPEGCFLVGGCVRDLLRGQTPNDYDVAVQGDAAALVGAFAAKSGQRIIDLGKKHFPLWRLVGQGFQVDFVPLDGATVAEDIGRRDFTVNAMLYEPHSKTLIDLHDGLRHLREKRIVMVSPEAFVNDPLRLLRAYRFAAMLDFTIEDATLASIRQYASLAAVPAAERILVELTKLLTVRRAAPYLRAMADSGVLFALFPEMQPMEEHRANNFSEISALEHTFQVVETMEDLLLEPARYWSPAALTAEAFRVFDDPKTWFRLKLAALLHDVGKPAVRSVGPDGRVHYYNHENTGSETASDICRRLRCSNADIWQVTSIVGAHMRALTMFNNHRNAKRPLHKRAIFFLDFCPFLPALFGLFWADAYSKRAALKEGYLDFILDLIEVYATEFLPRNERPLPLNGHDLIQAFKPKGIMMSFMVRELAVENVIHEEFTKEQALKVAKNTYDMLRSRAKSALSQS